MGFLPPHKNTKKSDTPLLSQIIDLIPKSVFINSTDKFKTDKWCKTYKTYDQFVAMLFGQLNKCLSLREISMGLSLDDKLLNDLGIEQSPAKSTMSDGNSNRDWRVFEEMYYRIVSRYKSVFSKKPGYKEIKEIEGRCIKLVDASIISVCLNLFEWAEYRTAKGGIKLHTSLDEATLLPDIVNISKAKVSDRRGVDNFRYEKDTIVVDDRGYFDFKLFRQRIDDENTFVGLFKSNTTYEVIDELELPDDKDQEILLDEKIRLTGVAAKNAGMDNVELRRVVVFVEQEDRKTKKKKFKTLAIITNNLTWSAATVSALYKLRWDIEVFFKLIKQNLQIKNFLGTNENACKSQIFISLIAYFLIELMRRNMTKQKHGFSHFVTLIRVCLLQYNLMEYIINDIQILVKKVNQRKNKKKNNGQIQMRFDTS